MREVKISDLEKNPDFGSVWILNATKGNKRGNVVLTVARLQGIGTDNVVIPATRVPLDLTHVISRKQLISDNQFRKAVAIGVLKLVNEEDVQTYFKEDPRAHEEYLRQTNSMSSGGLLEQSENVVSEVESFDTPASKSPEVAAPVKDLIDRIKLLKETGNLTEEDEVKACDRLQDLGELDEYSLRFLFDAMQGISSRIRSTAKQLAGRQ